MRNRIIAPLAAGCLSVGACTETLPPPPSGALVWSIPGQSAGTPAFDDASVFFLDRRHEVLAVDKRNGQVRWRSGTGVQGGATFGVNAVVMGSLVIVGDGDVHAFDRATGARRWRFRPTVGYYPGIFHVATDGTRLFAGSPSGHVYAINAAGSADWVADLNEPGMEVSAYSPVHQGGQVYVCLRREHIPSTGGIVTLDAASGTVLWRREFPAKPPNHEGGCMAQLAVTGNVVVGATFDGHLYAYNRHTGGALWEAPQLTNLPDTLAGSPYMDWRPLTASAGVVVAGSTTGWVVGFDAATGQEKWRRHPNGGSIFFPITADAGAVYLVDGGLRLISLDLATGAIRWGRGGHDVHYTARPVTDGDRVYVGGPTHLVAMQR